MSTNARTAFARAVLVYSPVWMIAVALVMRTRALAGWDDRTHVLFGVGLALPILALPWLPIALGEERDARFTARYATRAVLFLALTTWLQMLLGSELFFRRLGMEYHFHTTWSWNGSPVFLYPMTLAYFATYYVVLAIVVRAAFRANGPPRGALFWIGLAILLYAIAFAETFSMASPLLAEFFFYRDRDFMLRFGSVCYGTVFFVTMPLFLRLEAPRSLARVAALTLACNAAALGLYFVYSLVLPSLH